MRRSPRYPPGLSHRSTLKLGHAFERFRWSPTGDRIAAVHNCEGITIHRVDGWELLHDLVEPGYTAGGRMYRRIAWSPDGAHIAAFEVGTQFKLFDTDRGEFLRSFVGHDGHVTCLDWSPDGKAIVSGSVDRFLGVWDPASGELIAPIEGPKAEPREVAWSPDGRWIASVWDDKRLRIWHADTKELLWTANANRGGLCWRRGTNEVAVARGGGILLLDAETGTSNLLSAPSGTNDTLSFSHDGALLAGARVGYQRGGFRVWRTDTWAPVAQFDIDYELERGYTADGDLAFDPHGGRLAYLAYYGELCVLDVDPDELREHQLGPSAQETVPSEPTGPPPVPLAPRQVAVNVPAMSQHTSDGANAAPTDPVREFDVFLCHNSADKDPVRDVAVGLKERGLVPWLDEWELRPGLPWQPELERQIEHIHAAAVFVGANGMGPWQNQELAAFISEFVRRQCPVIPVLLLDCPTQPKLPKFLSGMTWVDLRREKPDPMEQLVWGITGRRTEG